MLDKNNIMILCKVVDNFGDIGVVYRLARALSDLRAELNLTLVVSNLESFHKMASQIDPNKDVQEFKYKNSTWKILNWELQKENFQFSDSDFPFPIILECFQCGRPDWLENILFSQDFTQEVQILNIDYLTAEDYAEEFHLLKSGTRKTNIRKRFFMPGFTQKTGGLIINEKAHSRNEETEEEFKMFFFAYEDDCSAIVKGISDFQSQMRSSKKDFSVCIYLAEGKSSAPFEEAWKSSGSPFKIIKLPFMQQEEFDTFILTMDFLFIRGEDSLARACLSGLPFVWQAYKQDENYQLVKVNALLDQMKDYFPAKEFQAIQNFWKNYNDYENPTQSAQLNELLISSAMQKNKMGFQNFAEKLHKNGNLAAHLLDFIDSL